MKRFKVEYVDRDDDPFWFDTRKEVEDFIQLHRGCPVDSGPVKFRITEFAQTKVEVLT